VIARLDPPLNTTIAVGGGIALLLRGTYDGAGASQPQLTFGREVVPLRAALPPTRRGERGRFWAIVDVPAGSAGAVQVGLMARTRCRRPEWASLGLVTLTATVPSVSTSYPGIDKTVAVCMAAREPDPVLFRVQIDSLRGQTHSSWHTIISDDASSAEARTMMREAVADDPRFTLLWHEERVGSYRNFERAVSAVPPTATAIAFCDQDDRWDPRKLQHMADALIRRPRVGLVCCDARIVTDTGQLVSDTFWTTRRHLRDDLRSITLANSVPGCLSLWDASLRDFVLPFPPAFETLHHDGWVASVAAATGGIRRVSEPLVDHVQHGANVLGHEGAVDRRIGRLGRRDMLLIVAQRKSRRRIAASQIDAALRPETIARTIRLRICPRSRADRRAIELASRDDERLGRVARHLIGAAEAQVRGGLPGTQLSVARGLLAARLYRRRFVTGELATVSGNDHNVR
jgi:hypothetical protein